MYAMSSLGREESIIFSTERNARPRSGHKVQAYFLKNPGNFVPLILVNRAESLKKKHTIVISVSSTLHLAHKKIDDFFICNPPSRPPVHTDYLRNGARTTRVFCRSV